MMVIISFGIAVGCVILLAIFWIVAWAHPTSGVVPRCAPSLARKRFQFIAGLKEMLARGYAVAATDYPGLGTPEVHPYLAIPEQAVEGGAGGGFRLQHAGLLQCWLAEDGTACIDIGPTIRLRLSTRAKLCSALASAEAGIFEMSDRASSGFAMASVEVRSFLLPAWRKVLAR